MSSPHPNAALIQRFYEAFTARDGAAMTRCYAPTVRFSDPVFPDLQGFRAGAMWQMLCARGKDLQVTFGEVSADETSGRAHWDATYTFSGTGRKVVNHIDARFELEDGLITRHVDTFDLWRWTRQALGPAGTLLGWTPLVQNKVRGQAAKALEAYVDKHGLSAEHPIVG